MRDQAQERRGGEGRLMWLLLWLPLMLSPQPKAIAVTYPVDVDPNPQLPLLFLSRSLPFPTLHRYSINPPWCYALIRCSSSSSQGDDPA